MSWTKGPWSWLMAAIWLLFAAIAVGIVLDDHTPGGLIIGGVLLFAGLFFGLRALVSHARLTRNALVYVGYARTHHMLWSEVATVEISELDSALPITAVGVSVRLRSGAEVALPAVAGVAWVGRNHRLQRWVQEVQQRGKQ